MNGETPVSGTCTKSCPVRTPYTSPPGPWREPLCDRTPNGILHTEELGSELKPRRGQVGTVRRHVDAGRGEGRSRRSRHIITLSLP